MKYKVLSLPVLLLCTVVNLQCQNVNTQQYDPSKPDDIFNKLVIYQIMVESYIDGDPTRNYDTGYGPSDHKGDLKGIIKALPYIKSLGVNAIWLTPIFDSDGDTRLDATGYFCKNYFKIDPKFGTLEDAKALVATAHRLGLYVFFDGVFGHHKQGGAVPSPSSNITTLKPNKNAAIGSSSPVLGTAVSFPASLAFYKEVATYWIDELEIDGWRLDQCYQVSLHDQDRNYWKDIREAVEAKCEERRANGKKWGILGYMVGEDWESAKKIQINSYSQDGLQSAFDFPSRDSIVRSIACDSDKKTSKEGARVLSYVFATPAEKGYSHKEGVYPNLFISNHDLVRFGNLLNWRFNLTRNDEEYWKRHKCVLSMLTAYTGPVTIYYGDEYGDMLDGYTAPKLEMGIANDNVGRSNGKYFGFNSKEENLVDYTASLIKIRMSNPALYEGTSTNLKSDSSIYADLKVKGNNKVVYAVNVSREDVQLRVNKNAVGGKRLVNLEDMSSCTSKDGEYTFKVPALSACFYKVE